MGVKEYINSHPVMVSVIVAGCFLAAMLFSISSVQHAKPPVPVIHDQQFYTIDDGATLFADSMLLTPPFDHDGHEAVQACVFKAGGTQWVQYLLKYSEAGKRQSDLRLSSAPGAVPAVSPAEKLVKRPGDQAWVRFTAPEARQIMEPKNPSAGATGPIDAVNP